MKPIELVINLINSQCGAWNIYARCDFPARSCVSSRYYRFRGILWETNGRRRELRHFSLVRRLSETSIDASKTSAKATPFQSISRCTNIQQNGASPTFVIFEMARAFNLPSPPPPFRFLFPYPPQSLANPPVTRNETLSMKGKEPSGRRRTCPPSEGARGWMKLSVTRTRLMHYADGRIARFDASLIDRSRIDYHEMNAGGLAQRAVLPERRACLLIGGDGDMIKMRGAYCAGAQVFGHSVCRV